MTYVSPACRDLSGANGMPTILPSLNAWSGQAMSGYTGFGARVAELLAEADLIPDIYIGASGSINDAPAMLTQLPTRGGGRCRPT